jgi:hypothetical protein
MKTRELRPAPASAPKAGSQLAKVTDLLSRPEGATIAELQAATGWLPHTTRAFVSTKFRGRVTTARSVAAAAFTG